MKGEFETPLIADPNEELDKKPGPTGVSPGASKWRSTDTLFRTVKAYSYLTLYRTVRAYIHRKKEPSDEAVGDIQKHKSTTFSVECRSTPESSGSHQYYLRAAEAENHKDDPLQPLALKFRLAASILKRSTPLIFEKNSTVNTRLLNFIEHEGKDGVNDVPIDGDDVRVRIFTPSKGKGPHPVIVYFHGGGFASGSPKDQLYDPLVQKLANASKAVVISVKYRLAPGYRYPTQYEDCFKVLQWLQETPAELPATADVSRCFLGGDSAGGNIVHHVGCRAATADLGRVKIRGWIMLQPFFGGVERTEAEQTVKNPVLLTIELSDWFWKAFLPNKSGPVNRDHKAANVFGPNAPDISRLPLPPILVVVGTHDILKDRQVAYAMKMASFGEHKVTGKKYYGGFHGFFSLDKDLQKILLVDINSFIQEALAKQKS